MAKGGGNAILEPVTYVDIHSSLIRISSRASCAWAGDQGFLGHVMWSNPQRRRVRRRLLGINDTNASNASNSSSSNDTVRVVVHACVCTLGAVFCAECMLQQPSGLGPQRRVLTCVCLHHRCNAQVAIGDAGPTTVSPGGTWSNDSTYNASSCYLPRPTCCAVDQTHGATQLNNGMPFCPNPTALPRSSGWYGDYKADIYGWFVFKVTEVNGQAVSEIHQNNISATWTIEEAKGINATVVTPPGFTPAAGDDAQDNPHGFRYSKAHYAQNGDKPWALYDGGVMVTAAIGEYLTYRMFQFKNDASLAAAKAEPANLGLNYAHPFPGSNGCNAEVVYEFKPKTGGGLDITVSTEGMLQHVIITAKWWATGEEVVVVASRNAFKAAARYPLPADNCTQADYEMVRFSRSFICKETGQRVTASIEGPEASILGNVTHPTTYADVFPNKMTLNESDAGFQSGSIGFKLALTAAQSPENCTTMYWDPYLQGVFSQSVDVDYNSTYNESSSPSPGPLSPGELPGEPDGGGNDESNDEVSAAVRHGGGAAAGGHHVITGLVAMLLLLSRVACE